MSELAVTSLTQAETGKQIQAETETKTKTVRKTQRDKLGFHNPSLGYTFNGPRISHHIPSLKGPQNFPMPPPVNRGFTGVSLDGGQHKTVGAETSGDFSESSEYDLS